jgi:hypothetical protein
VNVKASRVAANRDARTIALATAVFYFTAVVGLIVAALLNPEGGITGDASTLLTLPWSIFTIRYVTGTNATVVLHVLAGAVNASIIYLLVKMMWRTAGLWRSLLTIAVVVTIITTVVWFFNGQFRDERIRIVNDRRGTGTWMAIDEDGLKALSETPGMDSDAPPELTSHLVLVPNKTRGNYKGRYFLYKGGRLVVPFPTSESDNAKWVEVEKIRIIEGPSKGVEGWVVSGRLKRLLTMFAM